MICYESPTPKPTVEILQCLLGIENKDSIYSLLRLSMKKTPEQSRLESKSEPVIVEVETQKLLRTGLRLLQSKISSCHILDNASASLSH